jgi:hypothetical protein
MMVRNLDAVTLSALYEQGRYHLPLDAATLESLQQGLPRALTDTLEQLADELRTGMDRSLGHVYLSDAGQRVDGEEASS